MTKSEAPNSFFRRGDIVLLAVAGLLAGLCYALSVAPDPKDGTARYQAHRYFAWQAEAWLGGHLDLARPVSPELLALPDPYDPKANARFRMAGAEGIHDLTLRDGKLYLYWAPVPALVAYLPWRILTGGHLPTAWACWLFAFGAWLASAVLLARVAKQHFPATSRWILMASFLALAACSWAPVVLQRASVWETPIFAACCFGAIAWWLLAECGWAPPAGRWRWLAAASLAWGLAVGSRPIWIVGAGVLAVPLWLERARWREKTFRKLLLAAAVPLGVCVLGLLLHNFLRFGRPFEFGQTWQLAGVRVQDARLFSLKYAVFNLGEYLFSVPRAVDYYPFLLPSAPATPPPGHFGSEMTVGLFVVLPWLWLVAFAPRRASTVPAVTPVAISAIALLGVLILFAGITARYQLELAAPLALLAGFGLLSWESGGAIPPWIRRTLSGGALLVTVAATVAISCTMSLAMQGELGVPTWFQRVTHRIAVGIGWSPNWGVEAVELKVTFPAQFALGSRGQILVAMGRTPPFAAVCVDYPNSEHVRFSFVHGESVVPTKPIALNRAAPHLVRIELGAMLPPATHPFWKDTPAAEIARRRSHLRIVCDGQEIAAGSGPDYPPADVHPEIGAYPPWGGDRFPFSGEILSRQIIRTAAP